MADEALQRSMLRFLGSLAKKRVKRKIVSSKGKPIIQLQRALFTQLEGNNKIVMGIPHYWAVYVHDGRKRFKAKPGRVMVWWKDPAQDPRLAGGIYPQRRKDLPRLTKAQFKEALSQVREKGAAAPVVITGQIKKDTPGVLFFDNRKGMRGFAAEASKEGLARFRREVLKRLKATLGRDLASFNVTGPGGIFVFQRDVARVRI